VEAFATRRNVLTPDATRTPLMAAVTEHPAVRD
jgi:hypothetical protein